MRWKTVCVIQIRARVRYTASTPFSEQVCGNLVFGCVCVCACVVAASFFFFFQNYFFKTFVGVFTTVPMISSEANPIRPHALPTFGGAGGVGPGGEGCGGGGGLLHCVLFAPGLIPALQLQLPGLPVTSIRIAHKCQLECQLACGYWLATEPRGRNCRRYREHLAHAGSGTHSCPPPGPPRVE